MSTRADDPTIVSSVSRMPARLGRYTLLERLGAGGMAEVYLANQDGAAGFHKRVVVKRILPHLATSRDFVAMFQREAQVAAKITHPNVVQILELGEDNGEYFIAMEFIEGVTLHRLAVAAWERGEPVPVDVLVRALSDAAYGLHAAHTLSDASGKALHLVHRDISPDNLMIDKAGTTKVLDFGIAKGDLDGPKTQTGNLRGKVPFMPPEQVKGEPLDARADLYALGLSAYWLLTGQRPFDRASDYKTLHAIVHEPLVPPRSLNASIPAGLSTLIEHLLRKDREQRPANAKVVAERFEELASPNSMGGKRSTVAFLERLLPAAQGHGNPVSEQVQAKPMAVALPPHTKSLAEVNVADLADITEPVEPLAPPAIADARTRISDAAARNTPSTPQKTQQVQHTQVQKGGLHAPKRDDVVAVAAISRPAERNPFGNVLAPQRDGLSAGKVVAFGVVGLAVVVAGGFYLLQQSKDDTTVNTVVDAGMPTMPPHVAPAVDAGVRDVVVRDAGVVVAVRDAGPVAPPVVDAGVVAVRDAGPPPVAVVDAGVVVPTKPPDDVVTKPTPPPPKRQAVSVVGPASVTWWADGKKMGKGTTTLQLPVDVTQVSARDEATAGQSNFTLPGDVNYGSLPKGTVQVLLNDPKTIVRFGQKTVAAGDVQLPAGVYIATIDRSGKKSTRQVVVKANATTKLRL
jgi:serine/threonine protein kinase